MNRVRGDAIYADLNANFGQGTQPDLLLNNEAIKQALMNIFTTTVGEAGPIFEPEFGSILPLLLQEPMDAITMSKVKTAVFQAIARWEPRVIVDTQNTTIYADPSLQGYVVNLVYTVIYTGQQLVTRLRIVIFPDEPQGPILDYVIALQSVGWPGLYEFCIVEGSELVYNGDSTEWALLTTWTDWVSWGGSGGTNFQYTALVNRFTTQPRTITAKFGSPDYRTVIEVLMATSLDGTTYTPFAAIPLYPVSAQYYKFKVLVSNPAVDPSLNLGVLTFYLPA